MKEIFIVLFVTLFMIYIKDVHYCRFSKCPFIGQTKFIKGCGNCESNTNCWVLDSIHFTNPQLYYDSCEDILYKN